MHAAAGVQENSWFELSTASAILNRRCNMRRYDMALTMMWCSGWSHVTLLSVLHGSVVAQSRRDVIVNENGLYSSSILSNNNLLRQVAGVGN
jgi:hypothetical protein